MDAWRTQIRCYRSPAGNNKIADWYDDLSKPEKEAMDTLMRIARKTREWSMPFYRPRLGGVDGLGELRWSHGGKQYRLIGFFRGGIWYAVIGCTHKMNRYDPPDALATAKIRKNHIESGSVTTEEYDL